MDPNIFIFHQTFILFHPHVNMVFVKFMENKGEFSFTGQHNQTSFIINFNHNFRNYNCVCITLIK